MIRVLQTAIGHAARRKILTLIAIAISTVMAAAIVILTGTATGRANLLVRTLQDAPARSVTIRTNSGTSPALSAVAKYLAALPGVEQAVAATNTESVTAKALHDPNTSIGYLRIDVLTGPSPVRLTSGRNPNPGEVTLSAGGAKMLRVSQPLTAGLANSNTEVPIVGTFDVDGMGPIPDLMRNAAVGAAPESASYATIIVLARQPADVGTIVKAINSLVPDRKTMTLEYEARSADIERLIATSGNQNTAAVSLGIVSVGALVQTMTALLSAILQRRENARRRALGFTRSQIIALTSTESIILALAGAVIGVLLGAIRLNTRQLPISSSQIAATVGLLAILALAASLPGGAAAAWQDPAKILRVP
jgi:hypothetical protein